MKNLFLSKEKTRNEIFPVIELNVETGICTISGNSFMQNPNIFYNPVLKWLKEYSILNKGDLLLFFNIDRMNTGTTRVLFELLEILKKYKTKGANVKIKWNFIDKSENNIHDVLDIISEFNLEVEALFD